MTTESRPGTPTFGATVAAQFRFDWARRWRLLALALCGIAAVPLARVARAPEEVLGTTFGVALAGGLCALFGYDAVVARQNDRSIAFDLLQPVSTGAVLVGRALFALCFSWLALAVTALPGVVAGLMAGRSVETGGLLLGVVAGPMGLLVGVALSGLLGTRDPLFGVHLIPGGVAALVLVGIASRSEAYGVDVVHGTVVAWAIGAAVIGLLWGWWAQIEKGRVDPVLGHRALARRLWLPIAAALLAGVGLAAWAVSPPVEELRWIAELHQPVEGNPWVPVTLANQEPTSFDEMPAGYRTAFYRPYAIRFAGNSGGETEPVGLPADASRRGPVIPVPASGRVMWSSAEGLRWVDLESGESGSYPWQGQQPEQWTLSPDGRTAFTVRLERPSGSGVPRWFVRRLDVGTGAWSPDLRLAGVALARYPASFGWLRPEAPEGPLLRLTVALSDGLAWFDFDGSRLALSLGELAPRGVVGFGRRPRLASLLRSQASANPVAPMHQHGLSGERTVLSGTDGVAVVNGAGDLLWEFGKLKSIESHESHSGEPAVAPSVGPAALPEPEEEHARVGDTSAKFYPYRAVWRKGRLLVQTWRRGPVGARLGQLLEVVDGRVARALELPGHVVIGAAAPKGEALTVTWTEAEGSGAGRRLMVGLLDLERFRIENVEKVGDTKAWLVGRDGAWAWSESGQEPWPTKESLMTDLQSLYRLAPGDPARRLLRLGEPRS